MSLKLPLSCTQIWSAFDQNLTLGFLRTLVEHIGVRACSNCLAYRSHFQSPLGLKSNLPRTNIGPLGRLFGVQNYQTLNLVLRTFCVWVVQIFWRIRPWCIHSLSKHVIFRREFRGEMILERLRGSRFCQQFEFLALFNAATSQRRQAREIRIVAKIMYLPLVMNCLWGQRCTLIWAPFAQIFNYRILII